MNNEDVNKVIKMRSRRLEKKEDQTMLSCESCLDLRSA